jgi:hypothetical protein
MSEAFGMNIRDTKQKQTLGRTLQAGLLLLGMLAFGQSAMAADGTAANHIIESVAKVRFEDSGGTTYNAALNEAAYESAVSITVNTVQVAPALAFVSSDTDVDNVLQGDTVTLTYTMTSLSNGPEIYTLTPSSTDGTMDGSPTYGAGTGATFSGGVYTVAADDMGATSAALPIAGGSVPTTATVATLTVPADDASGGFVNGLGSGDTVVITTNTGFWTCNVDDVVDTNGGTANATSTIDINNCVDGGSAGDINIGDQIGEQHTLTVVATTNTVTSPNVIGTHAIAVSADTNNGTTGATGSPTTLAAVAATTLTVKVVDLDIYKYVRNIITDEVGTTGSAFDVLTVGGETFYRAGVSALPGEYLEYAVVLINRGAPTSDVEVVDDNVLFTTYIGVGDTTNAAESLGDGDGIRLYTSVSLTSLDCDTSGDTCEVSGSPTLAEATNDTLATGFDFGGTNGSSLFIFAGVGGNEATTTGGTMATGAVSIAIYTLQID